MLVQRVLTPTSLSTILILRTIVRKADNYQRKLRFAITNSISTWLVPVARYQ
jgi:hypothetical protein